MTEYDVYYEPGLGCFITWEEGDHYMAQDYPDQKPYYWDPKSSSTKIYRGTYGSKESAFAWIEKYDFEH